MIKLVFFDCDGVLTDHHSSWTYLHEYFGSRDNSYFAKLYEEGVISYLDWMKIDIALMIHSHGKPIRRRDVEEALNKIGVRGEAKRVIDKLKNMGIVVGVISSGIDILVKRVCRELGVDICLYNELVFYKDELVPGGKPSVPLHRKPEIIEEMASASGYSMDNVAYIGDSRWDIPVFKRVGLPIAVEPCGEACRYAKYTVEDLGEIPEIIEKYKN